MKMHLKLIVVAIRTHLTERVIQAARRAGAAGATVLPARGTGLTASRSFFGLSLDSQRDLLLFLLPEHLVLAVSQAIQGDAELDNPGTGLLFVLDVEQALGLKDQYPLLDAAIHEH
ncbi:MAG: P-II family nitrogen regulator, partial [Magnetococcales bacterium]|nr:P-II family nitrogen regulator [Magnetococcales bacterium]